VLPYLRARKLRDLTATEVDRWLATLATSLSTRTLQGVRACLHRAVRRAMASDKVKRNVVELTEVPTGLPGRPSKAMTAQQADDVITKTASDRMHPYIVVSLVTGARTEELRALRWEHVHLEGRSDMSWSRSGPLELSFTACSQTSAWSSCRPSCRPTTP
jgi:integrase